MSCGGKPYCWCAGSLGCGRGTLAKHVRRSLVRGKDGGEKKTPGLIGGMHIQPLGEPETCQPKFICGLRRQGSEVRMTSLSTGIYFNAARAVTMEEYTSNPRR